jgi:hypothetical protein
LGKPRVRSVETVPECTSNIPAIGHHVAMAGEDQIDAAVAQEREHVTGVEQPDLRSRPVPGTGTRWW